MNVLENEIEDLIYEAATNKPELLWKRGLHIGALAHTPTVLRQTRLGGYGIMDLLFLAYDAYDKTILIHALELKKDAINYDTLNQGLKYLKGIEQYVDLNYPFRNVEIGISLIGSKIDLNTSFCYVADYMPKVGLFTYSLDFEEGLIFDSYADYKMINPDFKSPSKELTEILNNTIRNGIRRKIYV